VRLYHDTRTTYDLTVGGLHTYYVVAGSTSLLVHNHNSDECVKDAARKLADDRANGGHSNRNRGGAAEALKVGDGTVYTSRSYSPKADNIPAVHPDVQAILDGIPEDEQGVNHGRCGLVFCISDALSDGHNPFDDAAKGKPREAAANVIRSSVESAGHGQEIGECDSYVGLTDALPILSGRSRRRFHD
jgi:YwqJ-like deaminase